MPETLHNPHTYAPADPRLGRLPEFDQRSLEYPIRAIAPKTLKPKSRFWNFRYRLNQGSTPRCAAYSVMQEVGAQPYYHNVTAYLADIVYREAQEIDYWPGHDYDGTSVLATMTIAKQMGFYTEFRWALKPDPLLDVILAIGHKGPGVAGTDWYSNMSNPDRQGFVRPTGKLEGGHAYALSGVDVVDKYFVIANTWGEDWGEGGNAKISFADFETLLYANGEFAIPVKRT